MAFDKEQRRIFRDFGREGIQIMRDVLFDLDKVVTQETIRSLFLETSFKRNKVTIRYFSLLDTFKFRVHGRKPGTPPPIDPLIRWIEERKLDINPYALQKSIAEVGTTTPPAPYFETVTERLEPKLEAFVATDSFAALVVTRDLDQLFNQGRR